MPQAPAWRPMNIASNQPRQNPQRQPFNAMQDRSFRSASGSEGSANEVEGLLGGEATHPVRRGGGWQAQGRPNRGEFFNFVILPRLTALIYFSIRSDFD